MASGRTTWAHRMTRPLVSRLARTRVTPNQLTALRLATGLGAVACFAVGDRMQGGLWFLVSAFLDRADGELARLSGRTTSTGHWLDLGSDAVVTSLVFVGIGAGLRGDLLVGPWALPLGALAGLSVAAIFLAVTLLEKDGHAIMLGAGGFDPDDALFVVPLMAWVGWLPLLLVAAAIGAPLFLAFVLLGARRRLNGRAA
jgi:phosphatidylglycerophosphate synthase